jgi:phosphoglycerate dehydrogenase-like enzyme
VTRPRPRPVSIVVYHPAPGEAAAYARLIRRRRGIVIHACATADEMLPVIGEADVLYGWNVPAHVLARAGRLRWFQNMGAGVERVLVPELPPKAAVTRVAGIFGSWMAEYTLGWCLWTTQRVETFRASQRARRWAPIDPLRLHGATLCVVGLGDIGRVIARAAHGFGMNVIGLSRSGRRVPATSAVYRTAERGRALARADFVVLTVPLTAATRGLIGARELAAMRPTAWLINVARGPIVDEAALVEALRERRIGGAVLDVFATEPLPPDHPLWGLDNVVITPHISGPSVPDEIAPIFEENLRRFLAGRPLRFAVDRRRGY